MIIAVMSALLWYFKFKISVFLFTRIANVLLAFRSFLIYYHLQMQKKQLKSFLTRNLPSKERVIAFVTS